MAVCWLTVTSTDVNSCDRWCIWSINNIMTSHSYIIIIISTIVLLVSVYVYVNAPKEFPDRLAIIPTSQVGRLLYWMYVYYSSIHLSIHSSIHLSIHTWNYLSINLSIHSSIHSIIRYNRQWNLSWIWLVESILSDGDIT